jgi:protein-S-isoprenylcysteine O-methyltransferase Ste14
MNLDIRLPIGGLFTLLGLLLVGYGLMSDASVYERSLGYNVNLWWGVVVLVFGIIFLYLGRKGAGTVHLAADEPEGRETEAREHALGLEREDGRPRGH